MFEFLTMLFYRIDKNLDSAQMNKLTSKDSSRDIADSEPDLKKNKTTPSTIEPPPILKYIKMQVKDVFHAPLATLLKGAVALSEEHYLEIMPVAWELLLEYNQEVTACAASVFILCAVKCPQQVGDLMQHGLTHSDSAVRINSILR